MRVVRGRDSHDGVGRYAGARIPDYVVVPPGATVSVLPQLDGTSTYVVNGPASAADLAGAATQTRTAASSTGVQVVAYGTCTQSQSLTNPLPAVAVSGSTHYIPSTWSVTRGSGCSDGFEWSAAFWGTDPTWGYTTLAKSQNALTKPGYTTTVYMNYVCKGTSTKWWHTSLNHGYDGTGDDLLYTTEVRRPCNR